MYLDISKYSSYPINRVQRLFCFPSSFTTNIIEFQILLVRSRKTIVSHLIIWTTSFFVVSTHFCAEFHCWRNVSKMQVQDLSNTQHFSQMCGPSSLTFVVHLVFHIYIYIFYHIAERGDCVNTLIFSGGTKFYWPHQYGERMPIKGRPLPGEATIVQYLYILYKIIATLQVITKNKNKF